MSVRMKTEDGDIILSGKGKDGKDGTSGIPVPQVAEVGQVLSVKAVDSEGKPIEWETVNPSDDTKITTPQTATVGQLLKVKTVDSNGKPETWETANLSSSEVTTALGYTPINATTKGAVNGVASLGSDGKVPSGQLPSMSGGLNTYYITGSDTITLDVSKFKNISSLIGYSKYYNIGNIVYNTDIYNNSYRSYNAVLILNNSSKCGIYAGYITSNGITGAEILLTGTIDSEGIATFSINTNYDSSRTLIALVTAL